MCVTFPALLLWGDRDRAVSLASAQDLRRCFDCVEFELLPGTGHLPYEECPEVLTRLVNSFLTRIRASPAPSWYETQQPFGVVNNFFRNSGPWASQSAHTWSNSHSEVHLRLSDQV